MGGRSKKIQNDVEKAITKLIHGGNLSRRESKKVMYDILDRQATDIQISAFLVALRMKGETADEIAGAVDAVQSRATPIKPKYTNVVDTCGTGGDNLHTFNISTAAALVAAGAGVAVAKHGYRSVSGKTGSADVLRALGANIELKPEEIEQCLHETGIAFMFAPRLNTELKYAMGPRREIGARTIFNILGPLTNPAHTKRQVIGVYDKNLVRILVEVMEMLGADQVMVVNGQDGMDEISISGPTKVCELVSGRIYEYVITPENFELDTAPLESIQVDSVRESKKVLLDVLRGKASAARDIVLLNAGAAIKVSGKVDSIWDGIKAARLAIESGAAREKLDRLVSFSRRVADG